MKFPNYAFPLLMVVPALASAQTIRDMDAHVHGAGSLNIAIERDTIAIELSAPGADIVGFEHDATSAADRQTVEVAISDLARPLDLFGLPGSAGCSVEAASVKVEGNAPDGDEDHGAHEADHQEDAHDDHAHGEDDHDDHGGTHSEFHAEYLLACADVSAIDRIEFAYFERFANALELDVQIVTKTGAQAYEVERDEPVLDLRGMF